MASKQSEIEKRIKAMRAEANRACRSKEEARAFLVRAGIVNKDGKLSRAYR